MICNFHFMTWIIIVTNAQGEEVHRKEFPPQEFSRVIYHPNKYQHKIDANAYFYKMIEQYPDCDVTIQSDYD